MNRKVSNLPLIAFTSIGSISPSRTEFPVDLDDGNNGNSQAKCGEYANQQSLQIFLLPTGFGRFLLHDFFYQHFGFLIRNPGATDQQTVGVYAVGGAGNDIKAH